MAVHGDDFVCLSADDRLKNIDSLLKSKYTAKDMGTLGFEDSDVKSPSIVESCAVSTPRQKLQDKLVLDGRRSPILKKVEATRYRSACMRLSHLAQDRLDLADAAKHLAQRMSEPREFDYPVETCSTVFGGKAQSSGEISKTETC